jgi:ADP-ribose pyrophosphatase
MSTMPSDPRPPAAEPGDPLAEARERGEQVYRGALLDVRRDHARLPDGSVAIREYIVHPGAVLVVPVERDGGLIVERQFRYPHNRSFVEFPAGKLDPGEAEIVTGVRELREEVGCTARVWTRLGVVHPVISYSTETIAIYVAHALEHVGARLDPGEFLEIARRTQAELERAVDAGTITDAKSVAALALLARWRAAKTRSVRVRIEGRVQGVGYRDWTVRTASRMAIVGWVRNRGDGSVEAQLQGESGAVDAFIDACLEGPRGCRVERIEVVRAPGDETLAGFAMRRSE